MEKPGSPAWKALLTRAEMSLDDDALGLYLKEKAAKERKYERNVKPGGKAPYDFYMVQEVLVEYDRLGRLTEAVRRCGGSESECIEAKRWDEEIRLVWDFVEERIVERMKARAKDIAQDAQEGLGRLVRDEGCKLNPRAIKMALEKAVPELYGGVAREEEEDGEGVRGRLPASGGIMINIIGDAAAKLMAPKDGGRAGGVYIDV